MPSLVTDLNFVERKLQAGFFWEMLSDTEKVEAENRRCMEAFIDGFETYQFRPVPEIDTLRAVRSVCIEQERVLRAYPSVLQVCLNMPPANDCYKIAMKILEVDGVPHPLLKWVNKRCRPSLATSTLRIGEPVVHVSFSQETRDDKLLIATTRPAVYVCTSCSVAKRLAITDKLSAPPDGYLASTFTPDSSLIITAAATQLIVWRWEAEAPVLHNLMDMAPSITRCMSYDGITCVATQTNTGKGAIIETRKGRAISTLKPHGVCVCCNTDHSRRRAYPQHLLRSRSPRGGVRRHRHRVCVHQLGASGVHKDQGRDHMLRHHTRWEGCCVF
eukprot:TRINITY_DN20834_c0_g2_i1.p1 TRINITY_DN20834_c0_g2~~TRINITY_DN20834_c0_g2_i1.p1  ORF type:complete len:330 (+),score=42.67 TRINITY_DN20834_c0_g2_i1:469-1458(+)